MAYHVAGCPACRREADDLRRVASTLSGSTAVRPPSPGTLEERLQDIAGPYRHAPLYLANCGGGALPSRRRIRRDRAVRGGAALATVLASVFLLALLLAPEPPRVLWAQLYDSEGRATMVSDFAELSAGAGLPVATHSAANVATSAARLSAGGVNCGRLQHCFEHLAGLPLVAVIGSEGAEAPVRMMFTDGPRLLYVAWFPGILEDAHNERLRAGEQGESAATWQSGSGVWSVAADGDPDLLRAAVAGLPEAAPSYTSLLDRMEYGIGRLLGVN